MLWGIDLGGTKIEGVVLKSKDNVAPVARERIDTQSEQGYDHILSRISGLIEILKAKSGQTPSQIGIGTPGSINPRTRTMRNSNTLCLNGKPLKADLEKMLGVPVNMANDANCFALAEAIYGAGRGAKTVFGVILGTGVGGGLVVDGKAINGFQGIGGEWGHNVLEPDGVSCYCGKKGCVERVLSGPALQDYYHKISGKKLKLPEIYVLSKEGDSAAIETIKRLHSQFAKAIAVVINIVDPDAIVLGGGVSNIESLYSDAVAAIRPWIFCDEFQSSIKKNVLGDSAGVFGAALL